MTVTATDRRMRESSGTGTANARTGIRHRWPVPLYPALLVPAYTFHVWSGLLLHPVWLVRPLVAAVLLSIGLVALTAGMVAFARERERAGFAALALVVGLLVGDLRALAIMALAATLIVATARFDTRGSRRFGATAERILRAGVAIAVLATAIEGIQNGSLASAVTDVASELGKPAVDAGARKRSDVYVVLLDGYPGDVVSSLSSDDLGLGEFDDALRARGFHVQEDSRSNYLETALTLASMYTADHLNAIPSLATARGDQAEFRALRRAVDDGVVLDQFGDAGFERIAISSGYVQIGPRRVDRVIDPPQLTEFEISLIRGTTIDSLLDPISPGLHSSQAGDRIGLSFDALGDLAEEAHSQPRFVFAHIPAPHWPFALMASGNPTDDPVPIGAFNRPTPTGRAERLHQAAEYAVVVGRLTVAAIDRILKASHQSPAVVVFSDHGFDTGWDPNDPLHSDLNERTSNFLAVLSPGHPRLMPDGTTPVNIFPYVLNAYAGADLPLRSNTQWAWQGTSHVDVVELDPQSWRPK